MTPARRSRIAPRPRTRCRGAPRRRPRRSSQQLRHLRWTSTRIAAELDLATSTVSAVLRRQGLHRLSRLEPPEPPNRYCRRHPGELIHIDIKKLGRFERPGLPAHRRHGGYRATYRAGWDDVHVAVDDTSRLAYVEILDDETGVTSVGFLRRAIAWFATHGVTVERVMTDNGTGYRSKIHADAVAELRHQAPPDSALPAPHQRQGRAIHQDPPDRVGLRRQLPEPPPTRPTRSHPGSSTTTGGDHTAPSATSRPPAASPRLTNAPGIYI